MTRVIHTGDTHLGYRQYHSPERRRDYAAAFRRVVRDAVEADVDAVVHAGDLFHDRRPDLGDLMTTISILRELDDAGVPFLAIVGNHESTRGVTADGEGRDAQWLDLFERLGLATRLDAAGTRVGDAVLYGLDHVPRSKREDLDYDFEERDAEFAVLVSHGLFTPFDGGRWDLEAVLEAANVEFDAVLLGDNHDPGIERVGGAWATYCGSTERTSASEREERGYNVVSFDGDVQISRKGLATREFAFVDVELHEGEGVGTVLERVRERDVADAVVVVTISGDGEPVTPAEVERFGDERGALVTRVNDRRELAEPEADVEVSFADPDEAVRRRVREMGLSEAARRVDRTVRDDAVADSNVRDRVDRAVRELLDDDPAAFERVPEPDAESEEGSGTDAGIETTPDESDDGAPRTADRDGTTADRDEATADRDEATADRDEATADRDEATADRDEATADRDDASTTTEHGEPGTATATADGTAPAETDPALDGPSEADGSADGRPTDADDRPTDADDRPIDDETADDDEVSADDADGTADDDADGTADDDADGTADDDADGTATDDADDRADDDGTATDETDGQVTWEEFG